MQADSEAMGPLLVGRVLPEALASVALASSGASLAVLQAGSGAREYQLFSRSHVLTPKMF